MHTDLNQAHNPFKRDVRLSIEALQSELEFHVPHEKAELAALDAALTALGETAHADLDDYDEIHDRVLDARHAKRKALENAGRIHIDAVIQDSAAQALREAYKANRRVFYPYPNPDVAEYETLDLFILRLACERLNAMQEAAEGE